MSRMSAIGIIETKGFSASVEALDTLLKSADVRFLKSEKIGSGLVSVFVQGEVGAVTAAVEAGAQAAGCIGEVLAVHVIARPHDDLAKLLLKK